MRPVNLIPPEQRRGDRAPLRTGAAPYVVVAVLVVALVAVLGIVLTNNQIADRKTEIADLKAQEAAAQARADALAPYAQFADLEQARTGTVTTLAQSRFDWERVLRELAIVLPDDVWLVQLTGTVSPEVQLQDAAELTVRDEVTGPALEIVGCGASHDSVAGFVSALRDIDGVTRVTVVKSERPDVSADAAAVGGDSNPEECRTKDSISRFEIVAAFDAVETAAADAAAAASASTGGTAPAATEPTTTPASSDDGGVSETQGQEATAAQSVETQSNRADDAVGLIPGAAR